MRYLLLAFLLHVSAALPVANSYAAVAEASISMPTDNMQNYDLSGLSSEERQWFLRFINGTFFADGWQEIAEDILGKLPFHARPQKEKILNELGNKIGREWCRENTVRKIDTAMLKKWGRLLKSTARENPQLLTRVIDFIEGEVNILID